MPIESMVLINPPSPWLIDDRTSMPLGLLSIAAYVRERIGYPVELVDLSGGAPRKLPPGRTYYGLTAATPQWPIVKQLIAAVRAETPQAIILAGGPHPTALPGECLDDGCDGVVVGEGELTVRALLKGLPPESIPGLATRNRPNPPPATRIRDLDALPFPARDLVGGYKKHTIVCSRGCPFGCAFCCSDKIWGRRVATRSVGHVMAEIDQLLQVHGADFLTIQDETFGLKHRWLEEFCEQMGRRGIGWGIQTRARLCKPDFLRRIAAAGCQEVSLGIESGAVDVLARYGKDDPRTNLDAIRRIAQTGMRCRGYFIVGLPGENEQTVEETERFLELAMRQGLTSAILGPFVPYPGCRLAADEATPRSEAEGYERYYHYGSKEAGYGSTVGPEAQKILAWKDRLQSALGRLNEYVRYEELRAASALPGRTARPARTADHAVGAQPTPGHA